MVDYILSTKKKGRVLILEGIINKQLSILKLRHLFLLPLVERENEQCFKKVYMHSQMKVLKLVTKRKHDQNKTGLLAVISTLDINECLINAQYYCLPILSQFSLKINSGDEIYCYLSYTEEEWKHREVGDSPKVRSLVVSRARIKTSIYDSCSAIVRKDGRRKTENLTFS